ncbi:MAG: hypothetical protein L0H31_00770, partial [Nocardioidaceae bacterium]|nr:hypothetical protein [Nocardioidaceae bacterium]
MTSDNAHLTRAHSTSPGDRPPLVITADDDLLATLLPLAAASDVTPTIAGDVLTALPAWNRAPVV